jgi:glutamyl-tRNA(Gln) amidotransferase subunit E
MYPETDVPGVIVKQAMLSEISQNLPELLTEKETRYKEEMGLPEDLAGQIAYSTRVGLFELLVADGVQPTLAARTLEGTLAELSRDGVDVGMLGDEIIREVFNIVSAGRLAKEGIPSVFRQLVENPEKDVGQAVDAMGLGGDADEELLKFVETLVAEKHDFIKERGRDALGPLMGPVMEEFRGRVDGKRISEVLSEAIYKVV